jgi:threonyl-tRNA synthetase
MTKKLNELASLLLAKSVKDLYGEVILIQSNVNDEGFGYSFLCTESISVKDFPKIEKQMRKNIDRAFNVKFKELTKTEAIKKFSDNKYKIDLITSSKQEKFNICFFDDNFFDLCDEKIDIKLSSCRFLELHNVAGQY